MILTPTDRIVVTLEGVGYRRVSPFQIAGLEFEFPAVFMGDERSLDLVLVADLAFDEPKQLLQRVESVARTLDIVRSKRPLTLVLAGPKPNREVLEAMSRVCRVLPITAVKSEDADTAVSNSLAILMPLTIPPASTYAVDPLGQVRVEAVEVHADVAELISSAPRGVESVKAGLHELLLKRIPSRREEN
jgi:hypothetical protein